MTNCRIANRLSVDGVVYMCIQLLRDVTSVVTYLPFEELRERVIDYSFVLVLINQTFGPDMGLAETRSRRDVPHSARVQRLTTARACWKDFRRNGRLKAEQKWNAMRSLRVR